MNKGVHIRGGVLIVLGGGLAVFMGWLIDQIAPTMRPGGSPSGARFNGSAEQAWWINALLIGLLAFGIAFALYGLFMAVTGKESRIVKAVALALWALMIGASLAFSGAGRAITNMF